MIKMLNLKKTACICLVALFSILSMLTSSAFINPMDFMDIYVFDDGRTLFVKFVMFDDVIQEGWAFDVAGADLYVDGDEMDESLVDSKTLLATCDITGSSSSYVGIYGVIKLTRNDTVINSNGSNTKYENGNPALKGDAPAGSDIESFVNANQGVQFLLFNEQNLREDNLVTSGWVSSASMEIYATTECAIYVKDMYDNTKDSFSSNVAQPFEINNLEQGDYLIIEPITSNPDEYSEADLLADTPLGCAYRIDISYEPETPEIYFDYIISYTPDITLDVTADRMEANVGETINYSVMLSDNREEENGYDMPDVYGLVLTDNPKLAPPGCYDTVQFAYPYGFPHQYDSGGDKTYTVYLNGYFEPPALYLYNGYTPRGNIYRSFATISDSVTVRINAPSGGGGAYDPLFYNLNIAIEGEGTVDPGEGTHSLAYGVNQLLKPEPAEGYRFEGWFGDDGDEVTLSGDDYSIYMNSNKNIIARFVSLEPEPQATPEPSQEPIEPEADEVILSEPVPQSAPLPKTGGLPIAVPLLLGSALIGTGLYLKKKK